MMVNVRHVVLIKDIVDFRAATLFIANSNRSVQEKEKEKER